MVLLLLECLESLARPPGHRAPRPGTVRATAGRSSASPRPPAPGGPSRCLEEAVVGALLPRMVDQKPPERTDHRLRTRAATPIALVGSVPVSRPSPFLRGARRHKT